MKYILLALLCLATPFTCQATEPPQELEADAPKKMITYNIDLTQNSQGCYLFYAIFPPKEEGDKADFATYQIEDKDSEKLWTRVYSFSDANFGYDVSMETRPLDPSKLLFIKLPEEQNLNYKEQNLQYKFFNYSNTLNLDVGEFASFPFPHPVRIESTKGDNYVISDIIASLFLSRIKKIKPNPFL